MTVRDLLLILNEGVREYVTTYPTESDAAS